MRLFKVLVLFGLFPLVYLVVDRLYTPSLPKVVETLNQTALDFSLENFRLTSLKGKPILLHFWATWCGPCVLELPEILATSRRRKDIEIVAVSVDRDWDTVNNFFATHPGLESFTKEVRVLLDANSVAAGVYQSNQYPETVLINRSFRIDNKFIGPQRWTGTEMQALLDRIGR